ncbi:MAG: Xaa-Pro peptidase family protein [Chloroflexota bacterium]|nr:Xaa-Pro peptidase family protein [Chloroflexota bacterium]
MVELGNRMSKAGMDAALLLHHRDILYYANTVRPAALLVSPGGAVLFVRRGLEYARQEATVARVEPMSGFSSIAEIVAELGLTGGVLGTELDLVSAQIYQRLVEVFPSWSLADVSSLVLSQRMVKDEDEIAVTRHAAVIADAGHSAASQVIAPGLSELALAAEVEAAIRRAGHEGFQPLRHPEARGAGVLLMSGEHLSVRGGHGLVVTGTGLGPAMPYGPSRRVLQTGDLVVVDIGSTHTGYTADESRTFVVGPATEPQQALFAVARAAEDAVFEALRPGVPIADLYPIAEAVVAQGTPPHLTPGSLTLPGFVGHGIGLEIDEPPVLWPREETHLQAGMILAIEVEVSAPAQGTMVKLEDTIVVRSDGYELLTRTPRKLIECAIR